MQPSGLLARVPLYPLLLAVYAVVYVYAENVAQVFASEVALVVAAALVFTLMLWLIFLPLGRSRHKSAALAAVGVVTFFSYGHLIRLIVPERFGIGHSVMVALLFLAAVVLLVVIVRTSQQRFPTLTLFLNIVALVLLAMPLLRVIQFHTGNTATAQAAPEFTRATPILENDAGHPDVYFLILDGYSGNDHLMRDWGYDNSAFTDALEARGFVVPENSRSNYGLTLLSVTSTLNMRFFEQDERQPTREENRLYLQSLLANNAVGAQFQELGYEYVQIMSGFGTYSETADLSIDLYADGVRHFPRAEGVQPVCHQQGNCNHMKFIRFFLDTTLLLPLLETPLGDGLAQGIQERVRWGQDRPVNFLQPERALFVWEQMEAIATMPEATFTFAHILKPHDPIVFDSEGNVVSGKGYDETAFFDQLTFINNRTLEAVDAIIEQSSVPPIIIIQGDHGSLLGDGSLRDHRHPVLFEVLNAVRFPGAESAVPEVMTSVNTFRLLFNTYFDTGYDLLDNRHYNVVNSYRDLFGMVEVDPLHVVEHPEAYQ